MCLPGSVQAAAAKKFVIPPSQVPVFRAWTKYRSQGPQIWSTRHAPPFTPAIRSTIWQVLKSDTQAQAISNPMIDYLLWRQSLKPARFDRFHPRLSPALSQLLNSPTLPTNVPPPTFTPVPQSTASLQGVTPPPLVPPSTQLVPPSTPRIAPQAIPEPSSLILATGMMAVALWWRRRMSHRMTRCGGALVFHVPGR